MRVCVRSVLNLQVEIIMSNIVRKSFSLSRSVKRMFSPRMRERLCNVLSLYYLEALNAEYPVSVVVGEDKFFLEPSRRNMKKVYVRV